MLLHVSPAVGCWLEVRVCTTVNGCIQQEVYNDGTHCPFPWQGCRDPAGSWAWAEQVREVRRLEVLYFLSIGPFPYPLLCIRFYPQSYHSEG